MSSEDARETAGEPGRPSGNGHGPSEVPGGARLSGSGGAVFGTAAGGAMGSAPRPGTASKGDPGRVLREAGPDGSADVRNAVECLLLAKGGPLRMSDLRKVLDVGEAEIRATLTALQVEYGGRGLQIQEVAGGYQLCTRPEYGAYVQRLLRLDELEPLTKATLEVLAIVAYRQPVTRAEVDAVRGVQSVHHLGKLLDRRLIREVGRRPGPGRPILYGTTEGFLRYFGLKDLDALPPLADRARPVILATPAP